MLHGSLHNTMLGPQNTFTIVHDFALYNQLHMYGFSDVCKLAQKLTW